jgi:transcriptional regulator with XRE-family HTH domain
MPPSGAREIEFRRRQLGLSQTDLASLIGRSQGQLANALRGHDPISATVVNRLRDILIGERKSQRSGTTMPHHKL